MLQLAVVFYSISLIAQIIASVIAVSLIKRTNFVQYGWLYFAFALTLMTGRRISPMYYTINQNVYNLTDAALSVPISIFLLLGVLGLKKLIDKKDALNDQLSQMVKHDFLTSALSRAETFSKLTVEIERSIRTGHPIAFLSLDVDHFKLINDSYGHYTGDQVLKHIVTIIKHSLRNYDFIGRLGGEEFLIVLPETNNIVAMEVANRLRESIRESTCYTDEENPIAITVSIGISVLENDGKSNDISNLLQKYIHYADIAMYEAKASGRNKCCLYSNES
jgi:diguanylate cyclase (GGDEF)-like protein